VVHGAKEAHTTVQARDDRADPGSGSERGSGFARSWDSREHVRAWLMEFEADPQHSFPGHGQMKPETAEITR